MTISKNSIRYKLYKSFAIVLAMVLLLFIANYLAVRREHNAKAASAQAMTLKEATGKIRFQMMQNRTADNRIKNSVTVAQFISVLELIANVWRRTVTSRNF